MKTLSLIFTTALFLSIGLLNAQNDNTFITESFTVYGNCGWYMW